MSTDIESRVKSSAVRHAALIQIIEETAHAPRAIQEQLEFLKDTDNKITEAKCRVTNAEELRKAELSGHEKYRDSNVRRFLHKATGQGEKFDAKATKESDEYFAALKEQHDAEELLRTLERLHQDAVKAKAELEEMKLRHNEARQELDVLYDDVFAGENPNLPGEDELERHSEEMLQSYHDMLYYQEQDEQVVTLLKAAEKKATDVVEWTGLSMSKYSKSSNLGGATIFDKQERSLLEKCAVTLKMALEDVQSAAALRPIDVRVEEGSTTEEAFLESMMRDVGYPGEIRKKQNEVIKLRRSIEQQIVEAESRQRAATSDTIRAEGRLELARKNLQAARQKVFERIANSTGETPGENRDSFLPSYELCLQSTTSSTPL